MIIDEATGDRVEFDVVLRETHGGGAEVPRRRVERGVDLADHVRPGPRKISLVGFVTNHPLGTPPSQAGGITGTVGEASITVAGPRKLRTGADATAKRAASYEQTDEEARAELLQFSGEFDRLTAVLAELDRMRTEVVIVSAVTSLREYTDCVITSITAPREAALGASVEISIDLVQIQIAETRTVPVPLEPRGRSGQNVGRQVAKSVEPSAPSAQAVETRRSAALALFEGVP